MQQRAAYGGLAQAECDPCYHSVGVGGHCCCFIAFFLPLQTASSFLALFPPPPFYFLLPFLVRDVLFSLCSSVFLFFLFFFSPEPLNQACDTVDNVDFAELELEMQAAASVSFDCAMEQGRCVSFWSLL